eukprot:15632-Pleurochrysis_carterae.AAC.6
MSCTSVLMHPARTVGRCCRCTCGEHEGRPQLGRARGVHVFHADRVETICALGRLDAPGDIQRQLRGLHVGA